MTQIRKIQLHQLEMLSLLDEILREEGIKYFAVGGTALGAIRHEGFIPWDDDIDIAMLRPDYEKFLQIQSKLPENLFIINHESNKSYPCFFSKLMDKNTNFLDSTLSKYDVPRHIFIDVFPWDNINNWRSLKKKLKKTNKRLKRTTYKKYGSTLDTLKFIWYKGLYCFRDSNFFYKKMLTQTKESGRSSSDTWAHAMYNDHLKYDEIFPLRKVRFENTEISVPNKCEEYLKEKYGDYMTLPAEKDRINHSTSPKKR